jgi:hypothetical protein
MFTAFLVAAIGACGAIIVGVVNGAKRTASDVKAQLSSKKEALPAPNSIAD